jgi:hypothetical protein
MALNGAIILSLAMFALFVTRHNLFKTVVYLHDFKGKDTECLGRGIEYEYINKHTLACKVNVLVGEDGQAEGYLMTTVGMPWDGDHGSLHESFMLCDSHPSGSEFECLWSENRGQIILPSQMGQAQAYLKLMEKCEIYSIIGCVFGFSVIMLSLVGLTVITIIEGRRKRCKYQKLEESKQKLILRVN